MKTQHKHVNEFLILFLFFISLSSVYAQADSALGFFPLHTGDFRQYHSHAFIYCSGVTTSSYDIEQVIGDTILPTGFKYKVVRDISFWPGVQYLRLDTVTANVYKYADYPSPHDWLFDSLRATPGSTFTGEYGAPTECVSTDTATILGVTTLVKHFTVYMIPYTNYSLAYGFGRIQYIGHDDDPCYPLYNEFYRDLVYARIDSVQHGTLVNVGTMHGETPMSFSLSQNFPNPFNSTTVIQYTLARESHVVIKVFDILGRELATLVDQDQVAGKESLTFDASGLASGVYIYRLSTEDYLEAKKLILLK